MTPKPGTRAGTAVYTEQMSFWLSVSQLERITTEALKHRLSKSEVARLYLEAGLAAQPLGVRSDDEPGRKVIVSVSPQMRKHIAAGAIIRGASMSSQARDLIAAGMTEADQ